MTVKDIFILNFLINYNSLVNCVTITKLVSKFTHIVFRTDTSMISRVDLGTINRVLQTWVGCLFRGRCLCDTGVNVDKIRPLVLLVAMLLLTLLLPGSKQLRYDLMVWEFLIVATNIIKHICLISSVLLLLSFICKQRR